MQVCRHMSSEPTSTRARADWLIPLTYCQKPLGGTQKSPTWLFYTIRTCFMSFPIHFFDDVSSERFVERRSLESGGQVCAALRVWVRPALGREWAITQANKQPCVAGVPTFFSCPRAQAATSVAWIWYCKYSKSPRHRHSPPRAVDHSFALLFSYHHRHHHHHEANIRL